MSSNYLGSPDAWNDGMDGINSPTEQQCHRCHGTGADRDGADCVFCEGWGSVISRY